MFFVALKNPMLSESIVYKMETDLADEDVDKF